MAEEKVGSPSCAYEGPRADCGLVVGTLEGYDQLMNLVLDHVKETMRGRLLWLGSRWF